MTKAEPQQGLYCPPKWASPDERYLGSHMFILVCWQRLPPVLYCLSRICFACGLPL